MPFDTETISILEAEKLMNNAPWIERYLVGVAYNSFSTENVSGSYDVIDKNTSSYDMPIIVSRLNDELHKLGFDQKVSQCNKIIDLVHNPRS
jgi:hypothetical protein